MVKFGKWAPLLDSPERVMLLEAIMKRIKKEAALRGFSGSYLQMARLVNAQGVPISKDYIYAQMRGTNSYPFPLEALIAICKGYGIPLTVIFNPELFADSGK